MNTVGDDVELARPNEVVAPVGIMKNQEMVAPQIPAIHINLLLSLLLFSYVQKNRTLRPYEYRHHGDD